MKPIIACVQFQIRAKFLFSVLAVTSACSCSSDPDDSRGSGGGAATGGAGGSAGVAGNAGTGGAVGSGGSAGTGAAGGSAGAGGGTPLEYRPCELSDKVGWFTLQLVPESEVAPGSSTVQGRVRDGVTPSDVWEE